MLIHHQLSNVDESEGDGEGRGQLYYLPAKELQCILKCEQDPIFSFQYFSYYT